MESQQKTFKRCIADHLKAIYDQHEYIPIQKNFDLTVIQLSKVLNESEVDSFFESVSLGKLGVLYKMPTCILSMAHKYKVENPKSIYKPFTREDD